MHFTVTQTEISKAFLIKPNYKLHTWEEDARAELLFKLKGLREFFLTNPRKPFSTITVEDHYISIPFTQGPYSFNIEIYVDIDLFISYDEASDDLMLTIGQDGYRFNRVEIFEPHQGADYKVALDNGTALSDFIKDKYSSKLHHLVETQDLFDAVDWISTALRFLTPTGKPLTNRYMSDLMDEEEVKNKKTPTLVE